MFTGIVQEIGTVARVQRANGLLRLVVLAPKTAAKVANLESVAVDGVCLSVVSVRQGTVTFEVIPQTQRLTALGALRRGDRVNVEPSLTLTDRLSGHIVFGHIDATGRVTGRVQRAGERVLTIRFPAALRRFLIAKGPVTLDGVSLTVAKVLRGSSLTVHLIPETLHQTTLGERRIGERVNLELDYFAKLIEQFVKRHGAARVRA